MIYHTAAKKLARWASLFNKHDISICFMISSLSLTTNSGNYTKEVMQNNQNKSSSEVISFLKLSQVRNTETQKTEICIENKRGCFLFSRNSIGTLKTAIKKAKAVRGNGKRYAESNLQKSGSGKQQDYYVQAYTWGENYIPLLLPTKGFPSTHTFLFQVEVLKPHLWPVAL